MIVNDIDSTKKQVLTYLKKIKLQDKDSYDRLILFGLKPHDIVKYIERFEDCGRWPFDFVYQVDRSISQIAKKFLVDFPKIELQNEEDRVLGKLLRKNSYSAWETNTFFRYEIKVNHVIAYMERDKVIYEWNADYVLKTQQEVIRVKEFLL